MDDLAAFAADSIAEAEALEAQRLADLAAYEEFCFQNPWWCGEGDAAVVGGPNADAVGCIGETLGAAGAILSFGGMGFGTKAAVEAAALTALKLSRHEAPRYCGALLRDSEW